MPRRQPEPMWNLLTPLFSRLVLCFGTIDQQTFFVSWRLPLESSRIRGSASSCRWFEFLGGYCELE
jgi:hypothetical protein